MTLSFNRTPTLIVTMFFSQFYYRRHTSRGWGLQAAHWVWQLLIFSCRSQQPKMKKNY